MDTEKIKFSIRMDEELVRTADAYVQEGMALSRTEMIEDALRFYLGFLSAEKSEDYLLQSLSSMLGGTVKDSENRLARMDFKMAVELAKLCHVSRQTVNAIENNKYDPTLALAFCLARVLGTTVDALFRCE